MAIYTSNRPRYKAKKHLRLNEVTFDVLLQHRFYVHLKGDSARDRSATPKAAREVSFKVVPRGVHFMYS
jgi:hypothetical protein